MSENENEVADVDLGLSEDKSAEEAKSDSKESVEDQEKLDWRSKLSDSLKEDKSLLKFKTVDKLAESYIKLQSKIGKDSQFALQDKHTVDTAKKVMESVFVEGDYDKDMDESLVESMKKAKIPSLLANEVSKNYKKALEEKGEVDRSKKLEGYKKALNESNIDGKLERYLAVGLQQAGINETQYKEIFKDEAYNPKVVGLFTSLAKRNMSDKHIEIEQGKTGGLPSHPDDLRNMMKSLIEQKLHTPDGSSRIAIQKEINDIKVKLQKSLDKSKTKIGFLS